MYRTQTSSLMLPKNKQQQKKKNPDVLRYGGTIYEGI